LVAAAFSPVDLRAAVFAVDAVFAVLGTRFDAAFAGAFDAADSLFEPFADGSAGVLLRCDDASVGLEVSGFGIARGTARFFADTAGAPSADFFVVRAEVVFFGAATLAR
jgi:hypothetical protein